MADVQPTTGENPDSSPVLHAIGLVTRRTGLSSHVIRVWERRYGAVRPIRTGTRRRLYSEEEIERLSLLHRASLMGHSIGNIASLSRDALLELVQQPVAPYERATTNIDPAFAAMRDALEAVRNMDARELDQTFTRGMIELGQHGFLERLAAPLAQTIGDLWHDGSLTAAHEHFASAAIRDFLRRRAKSFAASSGAPVIIVASPSGQLHELGAMLVAAAAADIGWQVVYLGASLPASEIAGAAIHNEARAVALSIVYPQDDPELPSELETLRSCLPKTVTLIAGGRAAEAYSWVLDKIGALRSADSKDLYTLLESLRRGQGGPASSI